MTGEAIRHQIDALARARGCLLGGAIGDALGWPVEFMSLAEIERRYGPDGITEPPDPASITDDTQMTLFTAEGLIRAHLRYRNRGICHPPSVVRNAYYRWLYTQDGKLPGEVDRDVLDGWLIGNRELFARRAPGHTCLTALRTSTPIADSKGCGGVMRVAPVGLIARDPFTLAAQCAEITHGHPSSSFASGAFAMMIGQIVGGAGIEEAAGAALARAAEEPASEEVVAALEHALQLDTRDARAQVGTLGQGWVAEEALAIAVYAARSAGSFEQAVGLAANHDGDSDSTAAIAGNLMGAHLGAGAIAPQWLDRLEARAVIEQIAADIVDVQGSADSRVLERYPGW